MSVASGPSSAARALAALLEGCQCHDPTLGSSLPFSLCRSLTESLRQRVRPFRDRALQLLCRGWAVPAPLATIKECKHSGLSHSYSASRLPCFFWGEAAVSKRSSEGLSIRRFRRWDASPSTMGRTTSWTPVQGKPGTRTAKGTPVLTARYAKASMSGRRAGRLLLRHRSEALLISSFQAASSSVMGRIILWTHPLARPGSADVTGSLRGLPAQATTYGCLGRWPRRCSPEC